MRRAFLPLVTLPFAIFGFATPVRAADVSASAWSYETSDSHYRVAYRSAAISRQFPNAPGDSHASANGRLRAPWMRTLPFAGAGSDYNGFPAGVQRRRASHSGVNDTLS